jgi:hypothetical protein
LRRGPGFGNMRKRAPLPAGVGQFRPFAKASCNRSLKLKIVIDLPNDKSDTNRAEALVALGFPAVEPVLPQILEWVQDVNWPVARIFLPFLADIGTPLLPHVLHVLRTDDDIWKASVLEHVVSKSGVLSRILAPELIRVAASPTQGEIDVEVDVIAREILDRIKG